MLGDYGADVIKIEMPVKGDDTRAYGPPFVAMNDSTPMSTYFLALNRNKRSIAIDLKNDHGAAVVRALAAKCDVLVENYVPGKLDKMGLGYEDLRKVNPKLVYCSITGYGSTGPDHALPGYDVMVSARGGLMGITGTITACEILLL